MTRAAEAVGGITCDITEIQGEGEDVSEAKSRQAENIAHFMEDGPRLDTKKRSFILARDREQGYVFLGGLGAMGVGVMWFKADEDTYLQRDDPDGWEHAPDAIVRLRHYEASTDFLGERPAGVIPEGGTFVDGTPLPHPMIEGWTEYDRRRR